MFTLGRKIDLGYKTNKLIVLMTLLAAFIGLIVTRDILSGLSIGAGIFLTWALSRELDPKHEYSAFVAAALSLVNVIYYDSIQFLVILWLLLLLRMTNGISGKKLTAIDFIMVLALTIYLSFNGENSLYFIPFILATALLIRTREKTLLTVTAAVIALVLFIAQTFFMTYLSLNRINYSDPLTIVVITVLFLSLIVFWFISKGEIQDDKGNPVNRTRLLTAQLVFSMSILLLFLFGDIHLNNLIIYLSTITGITLYFALSKLVKKDKN